MPCLPYAHLNLRHNPFGELDPAGWLAPMIMETGVQAQFLVPMAVSLGFGLLCATFVTLLFVPVIYVFVEELRGG